MIRSLFCVVLILWSVATSAQSLKVVSFNLRYATEADGNNQWEFRKSSVMDFITWEEADFLGMQEVLLSQMMDLANSLDQYRSIGVARDDGKEKGEFSPIFYQAEKWKLLDSGTFWLSLTPDQPSKSWDAALPRICTWGRFQNRETGKNVSIFNTHFDHIGEEARSNSAALIVEQIKAISGNTPVVMTGDFNAVESSLAIQNILNGSYKDAYRAAKVTYGPFGTFNGFNYSKIPDRRIDYVFTSSDFEIAAYSVDSRLIGGRYLSDHFPVIVLLEER